MTGDSGASRRAAMYGENDLSSMSIFSGSYINFGYWQDLTPGRLISVDERTESQADLYRTVLRRLTIGPTDAVLEVGCGIAVGAALALREFGPNAVYGLDLSPDQLGRATRINAELIAQSPERRLLRRGSALELPFAGETFDKCYSVEAAQHFEDLAGFASEVHRVLKPGGRLAVTTFFTPHPDAIDGLRRLIETVDNGTTSSSRSTLFETICSRQVLSTWVLRASVSMSGAVSTPGWARPSSATAGAATGARHTIMGSSTITP